MDIQPQLECRHPKGVPFNTKWDADASDKNSSSVVEKRAELRERFLWAVTGLTGHEVKVTMMENLSVKEKTEENNFL